MSKHKWILTEYGDIDVFRYDYGIHNGPECELCGKCVCQHCNPEIYIEECPKGVEEDEVTD